MLVKLKKKKKAKSKEEWRRRREVPCIPACSDVMNFDSAHIRVSLIMNVQSAKMDDHKIEDWTRAHYQLGSLLGNSCHIYLSEQPADSTTPLI